MDVLNSRYFIYPANDMNFGALLLNSKKTKTFVIENRGDKFDIKYNVTKMVKAEPKTLPVIAKPRR
jgi:hydrocephalus-inducing protein